MTVTRLSRILVDHADRPADRILARGTDGAELTFSGFLVGVARWRDAARACFPCSAPSKAYAVLYTEDAAQLLPALFGLWSAGVHVILAGDLLPGILDQLLESGIDLERCALALDAVQLDPTGKMRRIAAPEETFEELSRLPPPKDLAPLDETTPLVSLLTGGSTGRPKLVAKRLRQIFFEPEGIHAGLPEGTDGLGPIDVLGTVSAQHTYGLLFRVLWPLSAKDAVLVGERIHFPEMLAATIAETAARGRRVALITAPAHLKRLVSPEIFSSVKQSVAQIFTSTGPLESLEAMLAYRALGTFPTEVYGTTETGGIAWRKRHQEQGQLLTPFWHPVAGVKVRVEPHTEEGTAQPQPNTGRIQLSGRHAAITGADGMPETGWLSGSDLIHSTMTDQHGNCTAFELLGRTDRIVKVEGKRVALTALESALMAPGLAQRARVFPTKSGTGGRETLAVVLEPTPELLALFFSAGKREVVKRLREHLTPDFPPVVLPRRWRLVTAFPTNSQGKTTLADLEALWDPRRPEWLLETDTVQDGTRTLQIRFEARPDLEWFQGHFPEKLILPGVSQLVLVQWAQREFAHMGATAHPVAVRTLKFRAITLPGIRVRLTLHLPATPQTTFSIRFIWEEVHPDQTTHTLSSGIMDWA